MVRKILFSLWSRIQEYLLKMREAKGWREYWTAAEKTDYRHRRTSPSRRQSWDLRPQTCKWQPTSGFVPFSSKWSSLTEEQGEDGWLNFKVGVCQLDAGVKWVTAMINRKATQLEEKHSWGDRRGIRITQGTFFELHSLWETLMR